MKKLIVAALLCLSAITLFAQKVGDTNYINVNSANLKSSTGFFASNTGTVTYGDEVKVLALSGKYAQVQTTTGNKTGWIPKTSLTSKRVSKSGNIGSTSGSELALAGKGFTPEVEAEYKNEHKDLSAAFKVVDAMEGTDLKGNIVDRIYIISDAVLRAFITEGHLVLGE